MFPFRCVKVHVSMLKCIYTWPEMFWCPYLCTQFSCSAECVEKTVTYSVFRNICKTFYYHAQVKLSVLCVEVHVHILISPNLWTSVWVRVYVSILSVWLYVKLYTCVVSIHLCGYAFVHLHTCIYVLLNISVSHMCMWMLIHL